jgi:uncharacterized membrane protein
MKTFLSIVLTLALFFSAKITLVAGAHKQNFLIFMLGAVLLFAFFGLAVKIFNKYLNLNQ